MRLSKRITAVAAALCVVAGLFPLTAQASQAAFDDVPSGHMFVDAISWMADQGITRGCNPHQGNTRFCPDDRVTRGQMAAFLVRALGLKPGKAQFSDTRSHVFQADVAALADAGITKGCNPPRNDRFCPDDYVTRGQMAAFLVRALGLKPGKAQFSDTRSHVFQADVAALADAGITKGCNPPRNDRFCPDDYVTRGQFAAFLYRALAASSGSSGDAGRSGGSDSSGRQGSDTGGSSSGGSDQGSPAPPAPRKPVCKVDLKSIVPDKKVAKHYDDFIADKITYGTFVSRVVRDGGPFVQWIVETGRDGWDYLIHTGSDSRTLTKAFHEAVHSVQTEMEFDGGRFHRVYGSLILGVESACDSDGYAGPRKTVARKRIDKFPMSSDLRDWLNNWTDEYIADESLDCDSGLYNACQNLASLVWELNAYVLAGLLDDTLFQSHPSALPYGTTQNGWHHMFFIEMYLAEVKANYPDAWKEMRSNGWSEVLAAAWNQAEGVWPRNTKMGGDMCRLVFGGDHYRIVSEFTGNKAGTNPPSCPK